MPIEVTCSKCGHEYQLKDTLAGKSVRCKQCQATIEVPDQRLINDVDEYEVVAEDEFEEPDIVVARPGSGKRSKSSVRVKSGKRSRSSAGDESSGAIKWVVGCLAGAVVCCVVLCAGIGFFVRRAANGFQLEMNAAKQAAELQIDAERATIEVPPAGPPEALYPLSQYPIPDFPDLGPELLRVGNNVALHRVQLHSASQSAQPAFQMTMHVYMPPGEAAAGSRPLVIVAPAGSTLITGNSVDGLDYHDETLPYAEAGAVTIMFSLDGPLMEDDESVAGFGRAYQKFRDAAAGTLNAKVAIDFALAKLPSVDPQRIMIAGHSSAGTLALLDAAHEPRLAAALAYCPCTDVETRLGWALDEFEGERLFADLAEFTKKSSPMTHTSQVQCPIFLFHAIDDDNTPYSDTMKYHERLKADGKESTMSEPPAQGGHYDSMIEAGIPRGIQWLKDRGLL